MLCKVEKYDLSSVAAIICAAAPLSKEIQAQLFTRTKVDRFLNMHFAFGLYMIVNFEVPQWIWHVGDGGCWYCSSP